MSTWLNPVRGALDDSPAPVTVFFRDDDAGWEDLRLLQLLDLFADHALPVDVAAIPEALTSDLARELRARMTVWPDLAVHQHGRAHVNHEPSGRRCEFGPSRSLDSQRRDIAWGQARLRHLLGLDVRPIFTPPWNRCSEDTGRCLVDLGFRVLSRDAGAPALGISDLVELPVQIDWFARGHGVRLDRFEWGAKLADVIRRPAAVGIMLHHARMDHDEMDALADLLALLAGHDRVDARPMMSVVASTVSVNRAQSEEGGRSAVQRRSKDRPLPLDR